MLHTNTIPMVSLKKACLSLIVQIENKISSDLKRLFFAVSLYPLSFFANTPYNVDFLTASAIECRYAKYSLTAFNINGS